MGFWIYMFIMVLLIPCSMIGFGKLFLKRPPKNINAVFGYRTNMSMKNKDTWNFAHKHCGKLWYIGGLVLLPLSAIAMLCTLGKSTDVIGTVGGIICAVQLIAAVGSIFSHRIRPQKELRQKRKQKNKFTSFIFHTIRHYVKISV